MGDADGGEDVFGRGAFEEEAGGAGAQGVPDVVVVVEGGDDDDAGWVLEGLGEGVGGLDAVEAGHAHVHEDDVGAGAAGQVGDVGASSAWPTTSMSSSA
ncbi:hypothetical protein BJF83_21730 [Nocardiopsis sp. CNR-923]|nr:hypothetical protein BJF83_21730 [Nocardiopsis sp. CNR-923]